MAIFNKRDSSSYVVTLEVNNTADMELLQYIRNTISEQNTRTNEKRRVVIRGRKPIAKQEIRNFWTGQRSIRGYDWAGNVVGGIKNATVYDVYVYNR